jgi:hypothetical protein
MVNLMAEIPERYQGIARELAAVAQRHGLRSLHGTIVPEFDSLWRAPIQFAWVQGRHGDSTHQIRLTSSVEVTAEIPWRSSEPHPAEPG